MMTMKFDLSKYSTVAERLAQFHKDHEDGRIVTQWINSDEYTSWDTKDSTGKRTWVIKTSIYLTAGDQANNLPKATGHAFEVDGGAGANSTSALENGESSSIGRALMVMGYSMNKEPNLLASREEMEKVQRGAPPRDFLAEGKAAKDIDQLRFIYVQAKAAKTPDNILEAIKAHGESLSAGSQDKGAGRGIPSGAAKQ
jgi:hypothetical protein